MIRIENILTIQLNTRIYTYINKRAKQLQQHFISYQCWQKCSTKSTFFSGTFPFQKYHSTLSYTFAYTYVIDYYNPSVIIIDLVLYNTFVNFIYEWRDLPFKVDSERQIFWETFHGIFVYSHSFYQKSAESK